MFILIAYGSSDEDLKFWHKRARLHSTWLGLNLESTQWNVKPQEKLLFANIYADNFLNLSWRREMPNPQSIPMLIQQQEIWSLKQFSNQELYKQAVSTPDENETWIAYDGDKGSLSVWCGLMNVGQMYYRWAKDSFVISNDLRLLMSRESQDLDPAAWYSLFQFGAVSAPLTPFKSVKRVPPGHLLQFSTRDSNVRHIFCPLDPLNGTLPAPCSPEEMMEETLSMEIDKIPRGSGLFFSGGVDSGLLAALARRRGRPDLLLMNCDFSGSFHSGFMDPEAQHARRMAAHLGYELDSFRFQIALVPAMLARIGRDYTFVFGDYSTVASNLLAHHAADLVKNGGWIIDGTGADGIFLGTTSWKRLNRLYKIPLFIRKLLAPLFRYEKIFTESSRLSRYLGMIHQSLRLTPLQAHVVMQSRLAGIAFKAELETEKEVLKAQTKSLQLLFQGLDERTQFSLFDLLYICGGKFAAKVYDPLRFRGISPFFPFLRENVIKAGYCVMQDAHELQENKSVLKSLLLRDVPHEMIYRPKSGFTPPINIIFEDPKVRAFITDIVLSRRNPVRELIYPRTVERLFQRLWSRQPVFEEHFQFLWAYVFGSLWLDQQIKAYPDSTPVS